MLSASNINADDTPYRVLAPGTGKTKRGHMWTYVRDGTRMGIHAIRRRCGISIRRVGTESIRRSIWRASPGKLQVDGYAGFEPLFRPDKSGAPRRAWKKFLAGRTRRRRFFDIYAALKSPIAKEAIERIGALYQIERHIRGSLG